MSVKIVFFGYRQSGKTKLIKRMLHPELSTSFSPKPTPGFVTEQINSQNIPLEIWDFSGEERYISHRSVHFEKADIAVYCVDLSDDINNYSIDLDVQKFRESNLKAKIILIGTKADLVPNAKERLDSIRNEHFDERFSLSALKDQELAAFLEGLSLLARESLYQKVIKMNLIELMGCKINLFDQAKSYLIKNSLLYEAIDNYMEAVQHLRKEKYCLLGREVFLLVNKIRHSDPMQADKYIEIFTRNSYAIFEYETPCIKNILLSLAAAIAVTVFVGVIGFAIGYAFGLWAGPFAFLTGVAASSAAISVLAISGGSGLVSGLLTAYGLFTERTPKMEFLDDIIEAAAMPIPEI
ncbi:MAG: 50S ribosome-binding GTPase [Tatlockia sp.]|nr:50S ribosome-binding GTPase [Tatlockia sp.]